MFRTEKLKSVVSRKKIVKSFPDYVEFALAFRLSTVYHKEDFLWFLSDP